MKKFLLLLFLLSIQLAEIQAQSKKPYLISPQNGATFQKTQNLILTWGAENSETIFLCQYSLSPKFEDPIGDMLFTGNSLTITNLLQDTVYYWRVRYDSDTLWSDTWNFRTTGQPITPVVYSPANFAINQGDTLNFKWNYNEVNKSYLLQISQDPNFHSTFANVSTKDTSVNVYNLELSRTFFWRVIGLNADFVGSNWSPVKRFRTRLATPQLYDPTDKLRNIDTVLAFNWNAVDSAKYYIFQLSLSNKFVKDSLLLEKNLSSTKIIIDSLPVKTTMYWRVLAKNNIGDTSHWSYINTFRTRLSNPALLYPADSLTNRDTSMIFSWSKITGADRYKFILAEDENFSGIIKQKEMKSNQVLMDSLQYSKKYFWKVIAINKINDSSSLSNYHNFKTRLSSPALLSPKDSAVNVQTNSSLSWNPVNGASYYQLQISDSRTFTELLLDTMVTKTSLRWKGLSLDSLYYWRVYAYNKDEDSSHWSVRSFKTRPSILIVLDSLRKSVNLSLNTSDTLGVISISNAGVNQYVVDSIKIKPDSVFFLSQKNAILQPGSSSDFLLRFNTLKAPYGINNASLLLIRTLGAYGRDTIKTNLTFTLQKASAKISSDSLVYDNTPPEGIVRKKITISNKDGNISLLLSKVIKTGTDTASFKLVNVPKSIRAKDSVTFYVDFKPSKPAKQQVEIQFQTNSYPVRNFNLLLEGKGFGGDLAKESISEINKAAADTFETYTNNNKRIFIKNIGNGPMNFSIKFPKNCFKLSNDFSSSFSLKSNDTASIVLKYLTPNFKKINIDTLIIIHNGFGEDTIKLPIAGRFDSLLSVSKVKDNLRFNNESFINSTKILETGEPITLTLNSSLFAFQSNLNFRLGYYLGGPGKEKYIYNDGNYNFSIPKDNVTEKGLILFGELISRSTNGKIADSISVFDSVDVQTIIPRYKTISISVPRSIPAENKSNAKTKWTMFGFPVEEVAADSVFSYFGGMKNMKDSEWIVYQYNPSAIDSFSLFNDYYFQKTTAYFAAQSLLDTFKISYTYPQNIRSKKLSENIISLNGNGWHTISSPFLFDVQIDSSLVLRKYDPNTNSYKMTNVMKPGEGYFIEPDIKRLKLITFGKYNPLYYPKVLADIGWHIKLTIFDQSTTNELLFSIQTPDAKLSKNNNAKKDYTIPPGLQEGLEAYISDCESLLKADVSIKQGNEGAEWDFIVKNNDKDNVNITSKLIGNLPKDYKYIIYNPDNGQILNNIQTLLNGVIQNKFKLIIGTDKFINTTLNNLSSEIIHDFRLEQNYPNPFNPSTTINYQIPTNSFVTLKIYDVLGKEVSTLVNEELQAGRYSVDFNASSYASGVYFYRLITDSRNNNGKYSDIKKMILLK